ncbi:MAG: YdeI/OmpD-associated family protein [Arenimonas sp.]
MTKINKISRFKTKLLRPLDAGSEVSWAFIILPKDVSKKLPRRGRTSIEGAINDHFFTAMLEPDGQLSHWLQINKKLLKAAGAKIGDIAAFEIMPVEKEPEPEVPSDLREALAASSEAQAIWNATTTIARLDWIHWVTSAKQSETRALRLSNACDMLASGKRRVCCFDPSGYYSKAFSAPKAMD